MTNFHKVRLAVQTLLRLLTQTAARIAKECNKNTRPETTRVYKSSTHCAQSPGRAGWSQPRLDRGPAWPMAQPRPDQGPRGQAGHSLARTGAHAADGRALGLGQHSEAGAACRHPADSPVMVQAGRQRARHWRGLEVLMPEEAPAQMHFTLVFFFFFKK